MELSGVFFLDRARVDADARKVRLDGESTRLEPRVFAVLMKLATTAGASVSRADLLDCWPDGTGSDEALTQAISALRRALGDDGRPYRLIQTLPKSGYRLAVQPGQNAAPSDERRAARKFEASLLRTMLDRPVTTLAVALGLATIAIFSVAMIDLITWRPPRPEIILHVPVEPPSGP